MTPTEALQARLRVDTDPLADMPAPETLENFEPLRANGDAQPHDDMAKATPRPVLTVMDTQRALFESQMAVKASVNAQREARGRVAFALERFQRATGQTQTFEQLVREHLKSENEQRRLRVAGKLPPRGGQRRLGSAIDSFAYYTKAHGRGTGGGRAFARKAYPPSARGGVVPKE